MRIVHMARAGVKRCLGTLPEVWAQATLCYNLVTRMSLDGAEGSGGRSNRRFTLMNADAVNRICVHPRLSAVIVEQSKSCRVKPPDGPRPLD